MYLTETKSLPWVESPSFALLHFYLGLVKPLSEQDSPDMASGTTRIQMIAIPQTMNIHRDTEEAVMDKITMIRNNAESLPDEEEVLEEKLGNLTQVITRRILHKFNFIMRMTVSLKDRVHRSLNDKSLQLRLSPIQHLTKATLSRIHSISIDAPSHAAKKLGRFSRKIWYNLRTNLQHFHFVDEIDSQIYPDYYNTPRDLYRDLFMKEDILSHIPNEYCILITFLDSGYSKSLNLIEYTNSSPKLLLNVNMVKKVEQVPCNSLHKKADILITPENRSRLILSQAQPHTQQNLRNTGHTQGGRHMQLTNSIDLSVVGLGTGIIGLVLGVILYKLGLNNTIYAAKRKKTAVSVQTTSCDVADIGINPTTSHDIPTNIPFMHEDNINAGQDSQERALSSQDKNSDSDQVLPTGGSDCEDNTVTRQNSQERASSSQDQNSDTDQRLSTGDSDNEINTVTRQNSQERVTTSQDQNSDTDQRLSTGDSDDEVNTPVPNTISLVDGPAINTGTPPSVSEFPKLTLAAIDSHNRDNDNSDSGTRDSDNSDSGSEVPTEHDIESYVIRAPIVQRNK
ncbi:MAG: hypothetical protein VX112_01830 [Pseudomonadota bacterium]|nr:hypothetical protein [Pseudomonadota bacterium]